MEQDEQEEQLHLPEEWIEQLLTGTNESSELIRMSRNLWSPCRKVAESDGWDTQEHLALEVQFFPFQLDHFSVTFSLCLANMFFVSNKKEIERLGKKNLAGLLLRRLKQISEHFGIFAEIIRNMEEGRNRTTAI